MLHFYSVQTLNWLEWIWSYWSGLLRVGLGLLKVRRKAQTAFGSNEAAWTQGNASACVMVLPFKLAVGDETTKRECP